MDDRDRLFEEVVEEARKKAPCWQDFILIVEIDFGKKIVKQTLNLN